MKTSQTWPRVLAWLAIASASACNKVDNAIDCNQVCNRYSDCFDEAYNVGACVDACEQNADDEGYDTRVDDCENCMDDQSCLATLFTCPAECAGIVP